MTVEFQCTNPRCHKLLIGPDDWIGREITCPLCQTTQPVPAPHAIEAIPLPDDPSSPDAAPAERPSILLDCFRSVPYAFSNWSSILRLSAAVTAASIVCQIGLTVLEFGVRGSIVGKIAVLLAFLCGLVFFAGYFLRFCLDCLLGSLRGDKRAPDSPALNPVVLFHIGLRSLAMTVVYVVPVVTIPVMPLGYLALAHTNDHRALNPFRAFRAAAQCPGGLAAMWLAMILLAVPFAVVAVLGWLLVALLLAPVLSRGGCFSDLVLATVAGLLIGFFTVTFHCVCFHCFGALARHRRTLIDIMSRPGSPVVSGAFIAGGVVLAIVELILLTQR